MNKNGTMSYDARVSAAEYHVNVRDGIHPEINRMGSGFRTEHLRQRLTEIFWHAREGFDGHNAPNDFERRLNNMGVKISTVRKMFDGYRELRHEQELEIPNELDDQNELDDSEFEPKEFPAEYIGMADFRILDAQEIFGEDHGPLRPGTHYKHRLSAEQDGTWGIVIDLKRIKKQLNKILKECPKQPPDEIFGALFMFNLFHEHFHYLTELAAMNLSGSRERFKLYQEYIDNADWGYYNCDLSDCCKITRGDVREFVASNACNISGCDYGALEESTIGYQYPVEEAMANAHAIKCLKKLIPLYDGFNEIFPYIRDYIADHQPLGYADYDCFRIRNRFQLGERIMTRLMRGDISMPGVNQLQHEMIEGRAINKVLEREKELFSGLTQTENAYTSPIVSDDMAEVPIYILNCNKFPTWERDIGRYCC